MCVSKTYGNQKNILGIIRILCIWYQWAWDQRWAWKVGISPVLEGLEQHSSIMKYAITSYHCVTSSPKLSGLKQSFALMTMNLWLAGGWLICTGLSWAVLFKLWVQLGLALGCKLSSILSHVYSLWGPSWENSGSRGKLFSRRTCLLLGFLPIQGANPTVQAPFKLLLASITP